MNIAKIGACLTLIFSLILSVSNVFAQWTTGELAGPQRAIGGIAIGSKVLFGGGQSPTGRDDVSIYDYLTNEWTYEHLSVARGTMARGITSNGSKVFFGGGFEVIAGGPSDVVDIYDVVSGEWTTGKLSQPRYDVAATSVENLVFFAGGISSDPTAPRISVVDIYNVQTGEWTTTNLSLGRSALVAASAAGKAVFAGGRSPNGATYDKTVDIYDYATNTWSTAQLSKARAGMIAVVSDNKIFFAGGTDNNSWLRTIDIYDASTNTWTTDELPTEARGGMSAAKAGNKIYFAGGSPNSDPGYGSTRIDIYDVVTGDWTIETLPTKRYTHSTLSVGGKIFFAGGIGGPGNDILSSVDILSVCTPPEISVSSGTGVCKADLRAEGGESYKWYPGIGLDATDGANVVAMPPLPTTYTVVGLTEDHCEASGFVTVDVTVVPTPEITATRVSDTEWALTSSSDENNTWFFNDEQLEATTKTIIAKADGVYKVKTEEGGCDSRLSEAYPLIVMGLEDNDPSSSFQLYPNPSSRFIKIQSDYLESGLKAHVVILDLLGRPVSEHEVSYDNGAVVDISNFASGNYFIHAKQGSITVRGRFVKN